MRSTVFATIPTLNFSKVTSYFPSLPTYSSLRQSYLPFLSYQQFKAELGVRHFSSGDDHFFSRKTQPFSTTSLSHTYEPLLPQEVVSTYSSQHNVKIKFNETAASLSSHPLYDNKLPGMVKAEKQLTLMESKKKKIERIKKLETLLKIILLDYDGNVAHTIPLYQESYNEVLVMQGKEPLTAEEFALCKSTEDMLRMRFKDGSHGYLDTQEIYYRHTVEKVRSQGLKLLYPGAQWMIESHDKRGIITGLVSNLEGRLFYDQIPPQVFNHLDVVVGDANKPDPGVILQIAETTAIPTDQIVFSGDSLTDIEVSKRAKVKAICHNTQGHSEDKIKAIYDETFIVDNIPQMEYVKKGLSVGAKHKHIEKGLLEMKEQHKRREAYEKEHYDPVSSAKLVDSIVIKGSQNWREYTSQKCHEAKQFVDKLVYGESYNTERQNGRQ